MCSSNGQRALAANAYHDYLCKCRFFSLRAVHCVSALLLLPLPSCKYFTPHHKMQAQVNGEVGKMLKIEWQPMIQFLVNLFNFGDLWSLVLNTDCFGLRGFRNKWIQLVIMQPVVFGTIVGLMFIKQKRAGEKGAKSQALDSFFFVMFICYPALCQICFSAWQCTLSLFPDQEYTILQADDRVSCENPSHDILQYLSVAIIIVIGFGVPVGCAIIIYRAYKRAPKYADNTYEQIAQDLKLKDTKTAQKLVSNILVGTSFGALTAP